MGSMIRLGRLSALTLALAVVAGCSSDSSTVSGGTGGGAGRDGGGNGSPDGGGKGGSGGASTGGKTATGGGGATSGGAGGTSTGGGGAGGGGGSTVDASSGGSAGSGGADASSGADSGAANGGTCTADSGCASGHCVAGSCCAVACSTPGLCETATAVCVGGTTCQYGKKADGAACDDGDACTTTSCFDGKCSVDTTKTCTSPGKCTTVACNPTTGACDSTPLVCDDGNPCTDDACSLTLGCQFTANTKACDDNDACTTGDVCSAGACKGTAKNCDDANVCTDDSCNSTTGACAHANNTAPCDDKSGCTSTDQCSGGACVGSGNACGSISTACTACTSGTGCDVATGRNCTCPATSGGTPVLKQGGQCVLNNDECATNPCGPLATACKDPTPSATPSKDYTCTCGLGTTGNTVGTPCVDKNECTAGANPCGSVGTCTNASPPQYYTCACPTGYRSVPGVTGPKCGCDLSGTFVETVTTMVAWSGIGAGLIKDSPSGGTPTYGWSLRQNTVAANGTMTITTVPCGGMAPSLCNTNGTDTYAQFQPVGSWGKPKMRSGFQPIVVPATTLIGTVPGGTYAEPQTPALLGLDLQDPGGAWPPCRACVGVTGSCTCADGVHNITNLATWWNNAEGTNQTGVTTVAARKGGETIGDATLPDPPVNYPVPTECGAGTDYTPWPGLATNVGIDFFTTSTWYGASRIISALTGTSVTFDATANACVITGNVVGPDNSGKTAHSDARVAGCVKSDGSACTVAPASDEVGFYDNVTQSQTIAGSTFKLEKAPGTINLATILAMAEGPAKETAINNACEAVRTKYCPAGKVCQ